jgi:hypothetical protein
MSQPYDIDTFSQYVTDDFNWRVKEISDLKEVIIRSGNFYSLVARKATLTLIYAHWEGHVHCVTEAYLKFVARRKFKFSSLASSFQAVQLTTAVREWQNQRDSIALRLKIVNTVRSFDSEQFRGVPTGAASTAGNLNFDRFLHICQILAIDPERIVPDRDYLDDEIVGTRNRIAHGGSMVVTEEKIQRVAAFVLDTMRLFRTEVENSIALKRYERA